MYCYTLVSCDPSSYPNIIQLANDNQHPYEGKMVYINQVYNGNPVDVHQKYTLTLVGQNGCEPLGWLPNLGLLNISGCNEA